MAWLRAAPTIDEEKVGISFVDVLFALVVGEILAPLRRYWVIPAQGWSHLAVALTLTLGSWIGYHTSSNRPRYSITFFNLPFVQFVLDISMVILYWLAATTAEVPERVGLVQLPARSASALPEAAIVTASFFLYAIWDQVGRVMQGRSYYPAVQTHDYDKGRRVVTVVFFIISLGLTAIAWNAERHWGGSRTWVIVIDGLLVALLLAYRAAKELWKLWVVGHPRPPATV